MAQSHQLLMKSMGTIAEAAEHTAAAAKSLQADLAVWRRTAFEQWMRSHGVFILCYYSLGVGAYAWFEGWHALDSVYYLTATATTNGDIAPASVSGRAFSF